MRALLISVVFATGAASAEEAYVQTPAPVIHLADNLDEADGLGWCIDTVGRGYAEALHAHSCKAQGGDVQFRFDEGRIRSVAYEGHCVTLHPTGVESPLGLAACDSADQNQRFAFVKGQITPEAQPDHCVSVGATSRQAGPFMSRDLLLADCATTELNLRQWVIRN